MWSYVHGRKQFFELKKLQEIHVDFQNPFVTLKSEHLNA